MKHSTDKATRARLSNNLTCLYSFRSERESPILNTVVGSRKSCSEAKLSYKRSTKDTIDGHRRKRVSDISYDSTLAGSNCSDPKTQAQAEGDRRQTPASQYSKDDSKQVSFRPLPLMAYSISDEINAFTASLQNQMSSLSRSNSLTSVSHQSSAVNSFPHSDDVNAFPNISFRSANSMRQNDPFSNLVQG